MRINWGHLVFSAIMVVVWSFVMVCFIKIGMDNSEKRKSEQEQKEQNIRDNYSPMTEDPEVQKAYDKIR